MSIKPIIMQAESVRAILAGRKTQTRRAVKPQPHPETEAMRDIPGTNRWYAASMKTDKYGVEYRPLGSDQQHEWKSRYQPGDILYVKETWFEAGWFEDGSQVPHRNINGRMIVYREQCPDFMLLDDSGYAATNKDGSLKSPWKSPLHMPRWAARLWLKVTDVRVQRLQDISDDDAKAEGIAEWADRHLSSNQGLNKWCRRSVMIAQSEGRKRPSMASMRDAYSLLWDSLNAKRGYPWESDPWVWVYTFETTTRPEHMKETK